MIDWPLDRWHMASHPRTTFFVHSWLAYCVWYCSVGSMRYLPTGAQHCWGRAFMRCLTRAKRGQNGPIFRHKQKILTLHCMVMQSNGIFQPSDGVKQRENKSIINGRCPQASIPDDCISMIDKVVCVLACCWWKMTNLTFTSGKIHLRTNKC